MSLALALLGLLVVGPGTSSGASEEVAQDLEWEPDVVGVPGTAVATLVSEPPAGVVPPADLGSGRFARLPWGAGGTVTVAIDVAPGRERLWVDADLDQDLSEEPPRPWSRSAAAEHVVQVRVAFPDGEETVPVRISRAASTPEAGLLWTPWAHRTGRVTIGDRVRVLALESDDGNVRFDDPAHVLAWLDLDGDGRLDAAPAGRERIEVGRPFALGGKAFVLAPPPPSGARVVFRATDEPAPAPPPAWRRRLPPPSGVRAPPPDLSFEALSARLAAEGSRLYAERAEAIGLVGRLGTPRAFEALWTLATTDHDLNARTAAIRAMGDAAYLDLGAARVTTLARSETPAIAIAAVAALHGMGAPDRETVLLDLAARGPANVAGAAARALAWIGDERAVRVALDTWRVQSAAAIRRTIYEGLATLPSGPPAYVVVQAIASPLPSLRADALRDLLLLDPAVAKTRAIEASRDRPVDETVARAAVEVLGRIGDGDAVTAMLGMATDAPPALLPDVVAALAPIRGVGALRSLLAGLQHRDVAVRLVAADALSSWVRDDVTRAFLDRAGRERDRRVVVLLLETLGDRRVVAAAPVLLTRARDRDRLVREAAIRALVRLRSDDARVRSFLEGLLGSRDWEDHVLGIDAIAASGAAGAGARVLPDLAHPRWTVRLAAAEALGGLRAPEAIPPLVERLEKEDNVRVRDAVAKALYAITGVNLYDDAATWRRWLDEHGPGFVLPASVPPFPPLDRGTTRAGFYGIAVRSLHVAFVVDGSGSMALEDAEGTGRAAEGRSRFERAVEEVRSAVGSLPDAASVYVAVFHGGVSVWHAHPTPLTPRAREDLDAFLRDATPGGGTDLYDALEAALLEPEVDTVFLLSDGAPSEGRYVGTQDVLRAVARIELTRRIAIHAVSLGRDSELLRRLAAAHDGV